MVQLILIRSGSTDYDLQYRIQGTLDIPLSEAGQKEAAQAIDGLRPYVPKALYCCPGRSSQETAAIIGKALRLKPKSLDRLQNINLGLWQGMLVDEVRRKQPKVYKQWQEHPETVHPPDGETLAAVVERVDEALEKLARKHRNGVAAIIVPEPLASIVRHRIEGKGLDDLWTAANGCGRVDLLQLEAGFSTGASAASTPAASTPINGSQKGTAAPNNEATAKGENGKADDPSPQPPAPHSRSRIVYRGVVVEGR
jgi:probable phosphoglycerate mutase